MPFLFWSLTLILFILLVYFAICGYAVLTMSKVGDHPQYEQHPGTYGLAYEDVRFSAREDLLQIAGWYVPNPGARRVMVLVHGRNASKQNAISGNLPQLAAELHSAGLAVLMIDLRGHGDSEGKRYTFGVQESRDVLGAVDFLVEQGFRAGQIGVLGISLGGAAVIEAAAQEPAISAVVIESTFADINLLIEPNWKAESGLPMWFLPGVFYMWQCLMGFDLKRVKPADTLVNIPPRPILILHSNTDEMIAVQNAYQLKEVVPEAGLVLFDDCDHAELFRDEPEAYLAALIPFVKGDW